MTSSRDRLLIAWEAWDDRPGNQQTAIAMESACVAYAGHRESLRFRRFLAGGRRAGQSYEQVLQAWEEEW